MVFLLSYVCCSSSDIIEMIPLLHGTEFCERVPILNKLLADPVTTRGGTKNSGVGRENGVDAFHSYMQTKSVIVNYASDDECRAMDE